MKRSLSNRKEHAYSRWGKDQRDVMSARPDIYWLYVKDERAGEKKKIHSFLLGYSLNWDR